MTKKTKKNRIENIKKYGPLFIAVVLVFVAAGLLYQRTLPKPEILSPEVETQWDIGQKPLVEKKQTQVKIQPQPLTEEKFEAPPIKQTNNIIDNNYLTATFSDSFSSLAWIDTQQTSLYFDWTGTNILFPPDIIAQEMTENSVLDTFVPELVQQANSTVVFAGHHMLNKQKEVIVWDRDNDTWKRFEFDTLGIPQNHTIISINNIPVYNQWIVFTKEEKTHAFYVYEFDFEMKYINQADLGLIPQGVSTNCGNSTCLIYFKDSLEFFTLDMASLELSREKELQNMVREKDIDSVIIEYVNTKNERWFVGVAQKKGFEIWQYEPFATNRNPVSLIFSQELEYPGHLALLARANGRVFVFWASYFTRAYEIQLNGAVFDLSSRFGWRISENAPVSLYEIADFIYIINNNGVIIRFNNEINARIDHLFWLNFSPSFLKITPVFSKGLALKPNLRVRPLSDTQVPQASVSGYIIVGIPGGGTKLYEFTDLGFDLGAVRQIVSKQVNFEVSNIGAAQISGLEAGLSQSKTEYYLSNDKGITWEKTELGHVVKFKTQGNDLRWKIKIVPYKKAIRFKTPYLDSINFTYWYNK